MAVHDKSPSISVIVLNWNGREHLPDCLTSLEQAEYTNMETIVVDNGSTDGSVEYVQQNFPQVRLVACDQNLGYCRANNRAAQIAQGDYLLFLNNDTRIEPGCLRELAMAAESDTGAAIWACRQRSFDGRVELNCGLGCDPLSYPVSGPKVTVFYADGASLFIRRAVFQQLNGFDPHYFIFQEDVDLCWRARLLGYQVRAVHNAVVYHKSGGTIPGGAALAQERHTTSTWRRFWTKRNQMRNLLKNYSLPVLLVALPLAMAVDTMGMFGLLLSGQRHVIRDSYLKAMADTLRSWPQIAQQRRVVQQSRTVSDRIILQTMTWTWGEWLAFRRVGMPRFEP